MPAEGQAPLDVRPAITGVEAAKPNRRRAIIVCTVFAIVLGGVIHYLWTNHAYLKWRFIGSEPEVISSALEIGDIPPGQVVALVNSGATAEVRIAALGAIADSSKIHPPYDDRIVEAIRAFAADLPEGEDGRWAAAQAVVVAVRRTRQNELMPILKALGGYSDPQVRMCVAWALAGDAGLSEELRTLVKVLAKDPHPAVRLAVANGLYDADTPDWATAVLQLLLEDADVQVRWAAATPASSFRCADGKSPFSTRLRKMLELPEGDECVREAVLEALFYCGALDDDDLAALARDPKVRVAGTAKRFITRRASRAAERDGEPDVAPVNE